MGCLRALETEVDRGKTGAPAICPDCEFVCGSCDEGDGLETLLLFFDICVDVL